MMNLAGFGDADMLNLWDEDGNRLPLPARTPLGLTLSYRAICWGATSVIPFSAMHRYQRADSIWASCQAATLEDYENGFENDKVTLLPAYLRYDCKTDQAIPLNPKLNDGPAIDPKEFGDDWKEPLTTEDKAAVRRYFTAIEHLATNIGFLRFKVGGEETLVELNKRCFDRGLTFEVPRGSLTTALKYEIFDDLLIGNFMRVVLHGKWGPRGLYPDFSPYLSAQDVHSGGGEVCRQRAREDDGGAARVPPPVLPSRPGRLSAAPIRRGFRAAAAGGYLVVAALAAGSELDHLSHRQEGVLVPANGR